MKLITIPFTFFICMFIAVGGFIYDQAFMAWAGTAGVAITIGYCLYALAIVSSDENAEKKIDEIITQHKKDMLDISQTYHETEPFQWRDNFLNDN